MNLSVKGQHVDVGDALRTHIEEKLGVIKSKYFNRVTDVAVTFGREGHHLFRAHVIFHVGHEIKVQATAENTDAYSAFDEAAERVAKQLRRYKTRLRDHHERLEKTPEAAMLIARDYVLNTQNDSEEEVTQANPTDESLIVAETTTNIPTLSVSEAVMRLDLAELQFLLFKNAKTDGLNAIYRRSDGNIGWIDPALAADVQKTRAA